jgi:hypothetical protein
LVTICFSGGTQIELSASYWARKKFEGKRGKGIYPELYLLGIHDRCSPLLASEVSQASVALGSFNEACNMLTSRGCVLDVKAVLRITKHFAQRVRLGQQTETQIQTVNFGDLTGRRVVISTDGGRMRIRKIKRGPKTKKKRDHYSTAWREPKLLIIYVVNANGRADKTFLPIIDGILTGPDSLFELLYNYLRLLNIGRADSILFIADGATWIWDRVKQLKQLFELSGIRFTSIELIDFYHAVEHLHTFSKLQRRWSEKERKRWCRAQCKRLKDGKIEEVISILKKLTKGSKNKLVRREQMYFCKNHHRFNYKEIRMFGLPMGSGAMESAVRRVVNLRLKSASMYWNEDTAMEMLCLRSYYKAGRWNNVKELAHIGAREEAA